MATWRFDISMSLDGFMTAAHVRPDEPIGDGGADPPQLGGGR
jgi:hypothetical protein